MKDFFDVPQIIEEARQSAIAKAKPGKKPGLNWALIALISVVLAFFTELATLFVYVPGYLILKVLNLISPTTDTAISLYSTVVITVLFVLYARFVEKRPIRTIGFVKKGAVINYLLGVALGVGLFSLIVLFCVLTGSLKLTLSGSINFGTILFCFGGWLFQGLEEEVMCRGFMMVSLTRRYSIPFGIIFNSLFFACLHLLNPGMSVLPFINIFLFGVLASLMFIKTGSIWMCAATHSIWNFVQGNVFGIKVSGNDLIDTVFAGDMISGKEILNGGDFGLEGGLITSIVLIIAIVVFIFLPSKITDRTRTVNE